MTHSLRFCLLVTLLGGLAASQGHAQSGPNAVGSGVPIPAAFKPDSVFVNPEILPRFVGGDKAFADYLRKNIRYPPQALQQHVSGRVFVSFVLNAQGRVQDAHVLRGPGSGLNDEALRLVWLMPAWEPARVHGQPVRVACTVPIAFTSEQ